MLQKLKELAAEATDDEEIVSDLIPQDKSYNSNKSRYQIVTNSTVIPVLIYQTGYNSPTIVHSLAKFSREKDRYSLKEVGAIGKKGSENDVVWITLQARQFRWKRVNIPKVKGDGTDAMSISTTIPTIGESFFNLTLCKT